jgi:hypothetical protein
VAVALAQRGIAGAVAVVAVAVAVLVQPGIAVAVAVVAVDGVVGVAQPVVSCVERKGSCWVWGT